MAFGGPLILAAAALASPSDLDSVGVTLLRQVDSLLIGTGVKVAQTEATVGGNAFEVNPAFPGQPASLFAWISSAGTATTFTNTAGVESWHADDVAANFYGVSAGVAPGVSHVDNYDASYFYNNIINSANPPAIAARAVNQSFTFAAGNESTVDSAYDNYAAKNGTIFVSGVGNGGAVLPPGTAYNSIGAGIYGSSSSVGPTTNGRSKPDLVAPDLANDPYQADSFAIPYVTGSAALLLQAASRGDGGANTSAAGDLRLIKAILLNGAIKPADWTNGVTTPLDARFGAGIVNVFNSWMQLKGGQHAFVETSSNVSGGSHPPGASTNNEPALAGWDLNSITNARSGLAYKESVNHYYFRLSGPNAFSLTATLVWHRQQNQTSVNDLNLFLYDTANSNLVAHSVSTVDNVEHIFLPSLPPGRYDLQVQKNPIGQVSTSETYALAFEFFNLKLSLSQSGTNLVLSWPLAPAGFRLVSTASLSPPIVWTTASATIAISNDQNVAVIPPSANGQFFRLQRP